MNRLYPGECPILNYTSLSWAKAPFYRSQTIRPSSIATESRFPCTECDTLHLSSSDLARHQSSVHKKYTPYFCYELGCRRPRERGFTRKDNFIQHLRKVHKTTFNDRLRFPTSGSTSKIC